MKLRSAFGSNDISLVLISTDDPRESGRVRRFLKEFGGGHPSLIIDNPSAHFIDTLDTAWSGAIPASFFFDSRGRLLEWWEGETNFVRYKAVIDQHLHRAR